MAGPVRARGGASPGVGRSQSRGGAREGWGGVVRGVSRAEPLCLLSPLRSRAARGRRWGRAASGVAERPWRHSLPRPAGRCLAAAPRAGPVAGQSGSLPTRPRPCGGTGLQVGRGPGRRRGGPRKGRGRAITRAARAAGSGRFRVPGLRGDSGGALWCPSPFPPTSWEGCESLEQHFSK